MLHHLARFLQRVFAIVYAPQPGLRTFLTRGQTQESPLAQVTVAVLSAQESQRLFGVPLARRSIQPVFLRIVNRSDNAAVRRLVMRQGHRGVDWQSVASVGAAGLVNDDFRGAMPGCAVQSLRDNHGVTWKHCVSNRDWPCTPVNEASIS